MVDLAGRQPRADWRRNLSRLASALLAPPAGGAPSQGGVRRIPWAWTTAAGLGLVLLAMLTLDPMARTVASRLPAGLVAVAAVATNLGDAAVYLVPIGLVLILAGLVAPASRRVDAALRQVCLRLLFAFAAIAASGLSVNILKRAIGRVRPNHIDGLATLSFEPFSWHAKFASLPSGHATTAGAMAAVVFLFFGTRLRVVAIFVMLVVAASRIILGAHFPADVLAGTMFGWAFTRVLALFLARRGLVFRELPTGRLVPRGRNAAKTLRAWVARRGAL